jgi:DNA (cytosine-5)-methyltransferase 1
MGVAGHVLWGDAVKKALDLFCGAGGAAIGLQRVGFEVIGIDHLPQPEYPFEFIQADVLSLDPAVLQDFDLVWASPPCQEYSFGKYGNHPHDKKYPDLVAPTRALLEKSERPYIIENVPRAPIREDLLLCGEMFRLRVIRHRRFELSFYVPQPRHRTHRGLVSKGRYVSVAGHGGAGSNKKSVWQEAIGISHIHNKHMLAQAVPPAYSEYIARHAP